MCRFIETICIEDGRILNLLRHQQRMNATRNYFFGPLPELQLAEYIHPVDYGGSGRIRCRVTYGQDLLNVKYLTYQIRPVNTLKLVEGNSTDYSYKYADRSALETLFAQRGDADDVLITRNGLLTDTSIANIALWDGKHWYTPALPLLAGTHRAELLDRGFLIERDIPAKMVGQYKKVRLFNAMLHFGEMELPCTNIR